jgi:hypothetical protein
MNRFNTPLDIYKILPKSNCRECGLSTCMAFSIAVFNGQKQLAGCPYLDEDAVIQSGGRPRRQVSIDTIQEESMERLKGEISETDILSRAEKLGCRRNGGKLVIKCMGKDFEIDAEGNITSQCHTHAWFAIPLFSYILFGEGRDIKGEWVPFRELKNGAPRGPLFAQRCEKPLKEVADRHPELFEYLIKIFSGMSSSANSIDSDISVVLFPFPKVPVLVCYWKPEDDLESQLHIFFDSTAEENLNIDSIFSLGVGLANMLEKIMLKHG